MALSPGYGETPLDGDELDALLPAIREALGDVPTKAEVYDLEQAVQDDVAEALLTSVIGGSILWSILAHALFDLRSLVLIPVAVYKVHRVG